MNKYYNETLQKGSKGDGVKEWQTFLNTQGYNLSVDGDFGDNTLAATKDYQTKNGLGADGIVGAKTWGKAGYSAVPSSTFEYGDYTEGDSVITAKTNKENAEKAVAERGTYNDYYDRTSLDDIMTKIQNMKDFSYDLNGDALYQQYKDKYIQQGKMAMQDTIGQASAMTGGYGNSYAATAGNQAYQASLQNLNDIVPELYQMAYDKYNQDKQDLYSQYSMLSDDMMNQYGIWSDETNRLYADQEYANTVYNNERTWDYGKYTDDKAYAYQDHRDAIADYQWQADFDEGQRQFNESLKASVLGTSDVKKNNKNQTDDPQYQYVSNENTSKIKAELPTQTDFMRHSGGMDYNGTKYTDYNEYVSAVVLSALDNGTLNENEAYSVLTDLGISLE